MKLLLYRWMCGETAAFHSKMLLIIINMSYPCYIQLLYCCAYLNYIALGWDIPYKFKCCLKNLYTIKMNDKFELYVVFFYILLLSSFVGIVSFITCCELMWPVHFLFVFLAALLFRLRCFSFVIFSHSCCFIWENLGGKL